MNKSIRFTFLVTVGLELLIISTLLTSYISKSVRERNSNQIENSILTLTEKQASKVETQLMKDVHAAEALSGLLSGCWVIPVEYRRDAMEQQLRAMVKSSSITSAYAYWLPGKFDSFDAEYADPEDNPTGQFIMHYVRDKKGHIKNDIAAELSNEQIEAYSHSYSASISNPVEITLDGNQVMTSRVFSRISNSLSQDVGVAGIDIILEGLNFLADGSSIYKNTVCSLLTSTGTVMTSSAEESKGSISKYFTHEATKMMFDHESKEQKTEAIVNTVHANLGNGRSFISVARITVDRTGRHWYFVSETPLKSINKAARETTRDLMIAFIFETITILVGIYVSVSRISEPLRKTANALTNISEGNEDLTVRLKSNLKNEIGQVSDGFNKTMQKIGSSITEVKNTAEQMETIGEELQDSMTLTTESIINISRSIEAVQEQMQKNASGVTQAKNEVDNIVAHIGQLNTNIEQQASSVNHSSSSIQKMTQNINEVTEVLKKNNDTMNNLESASELGLELINTTAELSTTIQDRSKHLEDASKVIKKIASQTNLLAMNASIEAAHAGTSGQGFSVVASEIRKLAEESSTQGSKIQDALKEVKDMINKINDSTKDVQQQFSSIFELTKIVSEQEKSIENAMHEQTLGGKELLDTMYNIQAITDNVKQDSQEMMNGSIQVSENMDNIAVLTATVNSNMQNMTENVNAINTCSQRAEDCVKRNTDSITMLQSEIKKFR